ncbi:hypothetical protein QBC34DRAFT_414527 [Podospora aff. communis PSN243]|uniref:NWD NACHT-NTPase N-terminal domain-containing protein n=1 Tax=Podospora aff. communis PSN243 TaxID=3040156 RepID=A0AAV9G966_9PEZI|nr:hypothetical protein QBC34DRAFT_414527 [Podospora aff. communis PSN243]
MTSRLVEQAVRKLQEENTEWRGIEYIIRQGEGAGSGSSKTDGPGRFTVKELLDGLNTLQKRRIESNADTEQSLHVWEKLRIGERIDRTVGALSQFLAAGDVAVSFDPAHAALPWAGLRVVLVLLTSHAKVHDLVIACFHQAAFLIFQCESYEQIYLDQTLLREADFEALEAAVIAAYCESLLFLTSARLYAEEHSSFRVAKAPFRVDKMKDQLGRLSDCMTKLSLCHDVCGAKFTTRTLTRLEQSLLAATTKLEDVNTDIGNMSGLQAKIHDNAEEHLSVAKESRDILQEQIQQQLTKKEKKCLQSFRLTAANEDITYEWYKNRVGDRLEGTCQWFLKHPGFTTWLGQESGTLLVTADPGCGKSVLAKFLVDHVLPSPSSPSSLSSVAICYFFFKDNDQNTVRQALCAILHQLFSKRPFLIRHAIPEYENNGVGIKNVTASLWNILEAATNDAEAGRVDILLDALDECTLTDLKDLVHGLSTRLGGKVRVIATSRPYDTILAKFRGLLDTFPVVRIPGEKEDEAISQEVNHVIKHRVGRLAKEKELSLNVTARLEQHLLDIQHRTYLWVYLVFDHLAETNFETTTKEIIKAISTLPKSVNEAYEKILSKHKDCKNGEKLRKALKLILAAKRPLTLTEMNIAMKVDLDSNLEDLELSPPDTFESYLRNLCGLFISIYNGGVYFLHQTAREFLLADGPSTDGPSADPQPKIWQHSITYLDGNTLFAEVCLGYLDSFCSDTSPEVSKEKRGLVDYAAENWATHFREAQISSNSAISKAQNVCKNERCIATWIPILWNTTEWESKNIPPLGIASCLGLDSVVGELLETTTQLEMRDSEYGRTPLLWAAMEGHEAVVKLLLEKNADIEAKDNDGGTPLLWAAMEGHEAVVKLLLEKNADIEAKDGDGRTPLLLAAEEDDGCVVKLLLERNATVEVKDEDGRTPLSLAAMKGYEAVVKLLLEKNADVEAKDEYGQTPLSLAAMNGYEAVVKLLLEKNADVEAKDEFGDTPLSLATKGRQEAMVKLLEESLRMGKG